MKTRNLLESTIPVMYNNGMTDLADFLKVMASTSGHFISFFFFFFFFNIL